MAKNTAAVPPPPLASVNASARWKFRIIEKWRGGSGMPEPLQEAADAAGVHAQVASSDAAQRADVHAAARAVGAHAHHHVVLEAEPERRVGGLQAALGRRL